MCGVVGVVGNEVAAPLLFDGLSILQHRGQQAAGIATMHGKRFFCHKDLGAVNQVFDYNNLTSLQGNVGIGHIRYATSGRATLGESQPMYVNNPCGIMLAHNGNLTNIAKLQQHLSQAQRHINTNSDSELLLNVLAEGIQNADQASQHERIFTGVAKLHRLCEGAYSCVSLIAGVGILAFRDPFGIRPLVLGYRQGDNSYMVASESIALDICGFRLIDDVAPGEAVLLQPGKEPIRRQCSSDSVLMPCLFEYVYFARQDSILNGASVYHCRVNAGRLLGEEIRRRWHNLHFDAVVPIPEMGRIAAMEVAQVLGCPFREAFVKNHYVGRTFILPQQHERANTVRRKFNAIASEFSNKRVLLVDDSLVRGTTSQKLVEMVRNLGARSIHFAFAAPQVCYPNVYGIDMPTRKDLIASGRSYE